MWFVFESMVRICTTCSMRAARSISVRAFIGTTVMRGFSVSRRKLFAKISLITEYNSSAIHLIVAEQPHPTGADCKADAVIALMASAKLLALRLHRLMASRIVVNARS
jgi:hypothetical protein